MVAVSSPLSPGLAPLLVTSTTAEEPGAGAQAPPVAGAAGAAGAVVFGGVEAVAAGLVGAGLSDGEPPGALPDGTAADGRTLGVADEVGTWPGGATVGAPAVGDGGVVGRVG